MSRPNTYWTDDRFMQRACAGVQGLKPYDPGHDIVALRQQFADLIELGGNENPLGPSPRVIEAVMAALPTLARYPDPLGTQLKKRIAEQYLISQKSIFLGNGSHELLMMLAQVFAGPGRDVSLCRYCFAVYPLAAQAAGAGIRWVEALSAEHAMPLGQDSQALAENVGPQTSMIFLANPNNPTGTWWRQSELRAFMRTVSEHVLVVIDEAYAECVTDPDYVSAVGLLDEYPNLIVTRTFSKTYAIAGLRLGYLLAHPKLVSLMERVRESFNVNNLALVAGCAALDEQKHMLQYRQFNADQRAFMREELTKMGYWTSPSQTNFFLMRANENTAAIEQHMLKRGIVLRPMRAYGLADYLRVSVGSERENKIFLAAMKEFAA